jgi:hypothetical protein
MVTITPHTDPAELLGHGVGYTVAGQSGPVAINGRWQVLKHMDLGPGYLGMGGLIATTDDGMTASFVPYGTTLILND